MNPKRVRGKIDWMITLVPLAIVVALCILFFLVPEQSNAVLSQIRFFFGDTFGTYYLVIGLGIFILSLYIACSKYGDIVLGEPNEKPQYSFFAWGSMMFTCGLAADILFYSFSEWVLYATDPHLAEMGSIQDWAGVYPLFHWSFIPWGFYLVLAVAFGFMLHVRKRTRQKYSEACRPILGKHTDGWAGRIIDLLAVFALLAGTATTFSVATPLMATIIGELFHVAVSRTVINIIILLITCAVYTYSLLHGFKGISKLANICIYLFFGLLAFVLLFGGETRYIIETGFASLGKMVQNFIDLSTFTDPLRTSNFPQNWTIYYWAYWMVWCVAAPFFIGSISRGRTVRQTILGGYVFGVGSTLTSFIVLGNYSMGLQMTGKADFIAKYLEKGDMYGMIVDMIKTMPGAPVVMVAVLVTMIAFYATSFDSIALTASCYSYHALEDDEQPNKGIQLMWCILLILLPIALLFAESSMNNLQSVSIVAAFPIGVVIVIHNDVRQLCIHHHEIQALVVIVLRGVIKFKIHIEFFAQDLPDIHLLGSNLVCGLGFQDAHGDALVGSSCSGTGSRRSSRRGRAATALQNTQCQGSDHSAAYGASADFSFFHKIFSSLIYGMGRGRSPCFHNLRSARTLPTSGFSLLRSISCSF